MAALLGNINHISGKKQGNTPGNSGEPSRLGQGLGVPKTVSGGKSYSIRHAGVNKVPAINTQVASSEGKLPKIPKASKPPKSSSII